MMDVVSVFLIDSKVRCKIGMRNEQLEVLSNLIGTPSERGMVNYLDNETIESLSTPKKYYISGNESCIKDTIFRVKFKLADNKSRLVTLFCHAQICGQVFQIYFSIPNSVCCRSTSSNTRCRSSSVSCTLPSVALSDEPAFTVNEDVF